MSLTLRRRPGSPSSAPSQKPAAGESASVTPVVVQAVPVDRDREQRIARIRRLAKALDSAFAVPGTNWRFGWDQLIGFVPVVGDATTGLMAAYIVAESAKLGVPKRTLMRMIVNVTVDLAGGAVPGVGDLFDFAFKANRKNLRLVEEYLAHLEQ